MCLFLRVLATTALGLITVSGQPWPYRRDVFLGLEGKGADFMGLPYEQYRNKREEPPGEVIRGYKEGRGFPDSPELADAHSMYHSQVIEDDSSEAFRPLPRPTRSSTPWMMRDENDSEDTTAKPRFLIPVFESIADAGAFAPPIRNRKQQQVDQKPYSSSSRNNNDLPMKKRGSRTDRDDLHFQYYSSDVSRLAEDELEDTMPQTFSPERSKTRIHRQQPSFLAPMSVKPMFTHSSNYHHYNYHQYDSEEEDCCPYVNCPYHRRENTLVRPLHHDYYFPYSDPLEPHVPIRYFKTKHPNKYDTYGQHCPDREGKPKTRKKSKPRNKSSHPKRVEPKPVPESIIVPAIHAIDVLGHEHSHLEEPCKSEVEVLVVHSSREAKMLDIDEDEASKGLLLLEDTEISAPSANVEENGLEQDSYSQDMEEAEQKTPTKTETVISSNRESRKMNLDAMQNEIRRDVALEKEKKSSNKEPQAKKTLPTESAQTEEVVSSVEDPAEEDGSVEDEIILDDEEESPVAPRTVTSEAVEEEEEEEEVSADNEETSEAEYTEDDLMATTSALQETSSVSEENVD